MKRRWESTRHIEQPVVGVGSVALWAALHWGGERRNYLGAWKTWCSSVYFAQEATGGTAIVVDMSNDQYVGGRWRGNEPCIGVVRGFRFFLLKINWGGAGGGEIASQ